MTAGPFESEADARAYAQAVAGTTDPAALVSAAAKLEVLFGAVDGAGVQFGAYDGKIAAWLSQWEVATVAVICGWVQRAYEAGKASAGSEEEETGDG